MRNARGEIYAEGHRGTYTAQGRMKAENRRLEILLGQMEHLFCHLPETDYPREQFQRMWKTVLLHQFHDILPGSGIREVYEDVAKANAQVFAGLAKLREQFASTLPKADGSVSVFNSLGAEWRGCLPIAAGTTAQVEPEGKTVSLVTVPPVGFATFKQCVNAAGTTPLAEPVLENALLLCRFDADGKLISVFDKQLGREMLPDGGSGNRWRKRFKKTFRSGPSNSAAYASDHPGTGLIRNDESLDFPPLARWAVLLSCVSCRKAQCHFDSRG